MEESEAISLRRKLDRLKSSTSDHNNGAEEKSKHSEEGIVGNRYAFLSIMLIIIVLAVILRVGMLKYSGFFEPDGFFHYSVIRQAITSNHYIVPMYLALSGFPSHNAITEPTGFYYVTIVPYILLQHLGISYYNIMRLIPVFFGILDVLGVYLLAKYLTGSRIGGILGALFIAISSGDIARTAALVYRGDGFVTIFVMLSLVFFVKTAMEGKSRRMLYIYALIGAFSLDVALFVWGGAPFGVVIYMLAIAFLVLYAFIKSEIRFGKAAVVLLLGMLLFYAIEQLMVITTILRYTPSLGSPHFFVFYLPLLFGSLIAIWLLDKKPFPSIIKNWRSRAAFSLSISLLAAIVITLAFPNLISALATGKGGVIASSSLNVTIQELQPPTLAFIFDSFSYQIILAPVGIIAFLLLKRKVTKPGGIERANFAFLAVLSYFLSTSYLQDHAIRFNSLVSAPIAILSAYAVYSIAKFFYLRRNVILKYMPMGLFTALIILNLAQTATASFTSAQADNINPGFLSAMAWMYNNTPKNATVLDLWPDGSVVEGWAQRTSYTDSVGGQNDTRIYNFSRWLFSNTPDPSFLINASRPEYFVVRNYWYYELGGIAVEGNITNASNYGFDVMTSLSIQHSNNQTIYLFNSSTYDAELIVQPTSSTESKFATFISVPGYSARAPIRGVIFINESGGPYSEALSTVNHTLNYTLVVDYSPNGITGGALIGADMPTSNLFRFTYLCNMALCPYNASGITMQVVYSNNDTKIIKINYPTQN